MLTLYRRHLKTGFGPDKDQPCPHSSDRFYRLLTQFVKVPYFFCPLLKFANGKVRSQVLGGDNCIRPLHKHYSKSPSGFSSSSSAPSISRFLLLSSFGCIAMFDMRCAQAIDDIV